MVTSYSPTLSPKFARASTPTSIEANARIDDGVQDVREDIAKEGQQGVNHKDSHHQCVVSLDNRVESEITQPIDIEDELD